MIRMAHRYPHEVTIYAAGPMTDLALAIAFDAHFAELSKELIVMAGSINPNTDDPEFILTPRREFNFWMDPEASHAVLRAHWPRIVLTTVDISVKTRMEKTLIAQVVKSTTPAAQYVAKYAQANYLWTNWLRSRGSTQTLLQNGRNFISTSKLTMGLPTAIHCPGLPAKSPGWASRLSRCRKTWTKISFTGCTSIY